MGKMVPTDENDAVSDVPGKSLSADDVVPAALPTGAKVAKKSTTTLHASASSSNQGTGRSSAVGTSTSVPLTADQNDDLDLECHSNSEDSSDTCTDTASNTNDTAMICSKALKLTLNQMTQLRESSVSTSYHLLSLRTAM